MFRMFSLLALTLIASAPLLAQTAEKPAKKPRAAAAAKTETAGNVAHVRFLHAAPGAPDVDIYAREGEKIKTGLAYKGMTEYTEVKVAR